MMRYVNTVMALVVLLVSAALVQAADPKVLVIEGTGDSQVILQELAQLFENSHPGTRVVIPESVGSGGGVKALIRGTAGLARTARPLNEKERDQGLTQIPFAWSPVVFAAHPSAASVKGISLDQVLDVFQGKIFNWKALGGPDHKLYPVTREEGDSSRTVVEAHLTTVPGPSRALGTAGKVLYTTGETVQALTRNAFSFGYIPLSVALEARLHIFALDAVFPDEASVLGKKYPLVTTFYLVRKGEPGRMALAFLDFLKTAPAMETMRDIGVFPADTPY